MKEAVMKWKNAGKTLLVGAMASGFAACSHTVEPTEGRLPTYEMPAAVAVRTPPVSLQASMASAVQHGMMTSQVSMIQTQGSVVQSSPEAGYKTLYSSETPTTTTRSDGSTVIQQAPITVQRPPIVIPQQPIWVGNPPRPIPQPDVVINQPPFVYEQPSVVVRPPQVEFSAPAVRPLPRIAAVSVQQQVVAMPVQQPVAVATQMMVPMQPQVQMMQPQVQMMQPQVQMMQPQVQMMQPQIRQPQPQVQMMQPQNSPCYYQPQGSQRCYPQQVPNVAMAAPVQQSYRSPGTVYPSQQADEDYLPLK